MYRLLLPFLFFLGCIPPPAPPNWPGEPPQRIVSTTPSITEVLFDIGLAGKIIGDSSYTKYPPETAHIEKIGGYFDMNREKIISLKPDLIIIPNENIPLRRSLAIPVLAVDHRTLDGMLDSYLIIGELFGPDVLATAQQKRQTLQARLDAFEPQQGQKPVWTLICIGRSYGTGRIQNLFVAGADSFLSEVVAKAGGENAAASIGLLAPTLSAEGVIHLAPDVIIDIQLSGRDATGGVSDWQSLGNSVPAVRNRRILVLMDDFASIPGPRTPMLIEKIARYFQTLGELPEIR